MLIIYKNSLPDQHEQQRYQLPCAFHYAADTVLSLLPDQSLAYVIKSRHGNNCEVVNSTPYLQGLTLGQDITICFNDRATGKMWENLCSFPRLLQKVDLQYEYTPGRYLNIPLPPVPAPLIREMRCNYNDSYPLINYIRESVPMYVRQHKIDAVLGQ